MYDIVFMPRKFLSTLSLRRATKSNKLAGRKLVFLSTLSLRRATKSTPAKPFSTSISIHALLAESDLNCSRNGLAIRYFYPRSPCGERHQKNPSKLAKTSYFYPRSPCGERRPMDVPQNQILDISIHALLAESDIISPHSTPDNGNFYPRSPCGERLASVA